MFTSLEARVRMSQMSSDKDRQQVIRGLSLAMPGLFADYAIKNEEGLVVGVRPVEQEDEKTEKLQ